MSGGDPQLVVVDSGVANIGSVLAALERLGVVATVSGDWEQIRRAARVLLPGVGAAQAAMRRLRELGLDTRLPTLRQPLLGICLGMQLLFKESEEGAEAGTALPCLGILPGRATLLPEAPGLRVPHMGWSRLQPLRAHPLVEGIGAGDYAYFVHSYALPIGDTTLLAAEHGRAFSAVAGSANFVGAQFHPERSAAVGARLLANFLAWQGPNGSLADTGVRP